MSIFAAIDAWLREPAGTVVPRKGAIDVGGGALTLGEGLGAADRVGDCEGVGFTGTHPAAVRPSPIASVIENNARIPTRDTPNGPAEDRAESRAEVCPTATA